MREIIMTGKKKENWNDDSIGGFKTRNYKDSELITNQDMQQFTLNEKKKKE